MPVARFSFVSLLSLVLLLAAIFAAQVRLEAEPPAAVKAAPAANAAAEPFPPELTQFRSYPKNPVFTAGGPGAWDAALRERGWILREGETYHLWYTGYDGTREGKKMLGYATSPDGLRWTRHPDNPIYSDHWVEDMMVVRRGDTYYMFAEGLHDQAQLLTSTDRVHWKRQWTLDVRLKNGEPIPPGPFGTPTAWFENETWYLFYERGDQAVWLATSKDMKVWTNVQDEPVLKRDAPYDRVMIALNQIIRHGDRYYALFHGSATEERPRIWNTDIAVSDDLIHWTKAAENPLLPIAEDKSSGIVVHDGDGYRLYTMHGEVHVHFPQHRPAGK